MRRLPELARVKAEASFEQILHRYGVRAFGSGVQRMALCPFHADSKPSCSVHLVRKIFHCFGCGARGSVLDFVACIEGVSIAEAAAIIGNMCGLQTEPALSQSARPNRLNSAEPRDRRPPPKLDLDPRHPYLARRGIDPELAATFGLGYCSRGIMEGRICIPIHDERGALVAYAGRFASEDIPQGILKYKLPKGFEKRRVLFNLHRLAGAKHAVLVEGYWSVFRLHRLGIPALALMGRALSDEQEALLLSLGVRMLTLLLDGDPPGRQAADELLPCLAARFFVHRANLPDGAEPDTLPAELLMDVLRCSLEM